MLITAPGIYPDITPEQYFAEPCPAPAMTNTGLGILLKTCPEKFAFAHPAIGQPLAERKSTAAQYRGSVVHRLALGKGSEFAVSPYDDYRKQEARDWKAAVEARGIIPVKAAALEEAQAMAAFMRDAIEAIVDGEPYQTEVVIAWQERGLWCRGMLDVWCPTKLLALDVKTCAAADDDAIDKAFANGYGRQDAWYRRGLSEITGEHGRVRFGFLFVESVAPFASRFAESSEYMRYGSESDCVRGLNQFEECMKAGEWPGYAPRIVQPTAWLARQWEEAAQQEFS